MADTDARDYQWKRFSDMRYRVELSILYHRKRERFFELLDKLGKAVSVIGGSAALWKLADPQVVMWSAAAVACTSTLSLVMAFSDRARKHSELARGHGAMLAAMTAAGQYAFEDAANLDRWEAQLYELEAGEPPVLTALMIICENQIKIARGQAKEAVPLNRWHRWMAHLYDFNRDAIKGAG